MLFYVLEEVLICVLSQHLFRSVRSFTDRTFSENLNVQILDLSLETGLDDEVMDGLVIGTVGLIAK